MKLLSVSGAHCRGVDSRIYPITFHGGAPPRRHRGSPAAARSATGPGAISLLIYRQRPRPRSPKGAKSEPKRHWKSACGSPSRRSTVRSPLDEKMKRERAVTDVRRAIVQGVGGTRRRRRVIRSAALRPVRSPFRPTCLSSTKRRMAPRDEWPMDYDGAASCGGPSSRVSQAVMQASVRVR
jgi:hypothetical protein